MRAVSPTTQAEVDALVLLAVDALTSVRETQQMFSDQVLFGGASGFDESRDLISELLGQIQDAKRRMP